MYLYKLTLLFVFIIFQLKPNICYAYNETTPIDEVVNACIKTTKKDKICTALVELKQLGADTVEIIKAYIELTPAEYAVLTVANTIATGRFRIKTKSNQFKNTNYILDFKKDGTTLIFDKQF